MRPNHWTPVKSTPSWTVKLVACNDLLSTADLVVGDGENELMLSVSRPMWAYGPATSLSVFQPGEFASRIKEDLAIDQLDETQQLGVDPDSPAIKFAAATASSEHNMRDIEGSLPLFGALHSATATTPGAVLVLVDFDGSIAVNYTPGVPSKAVTKDVVNEVMNGTDSHHTTKAGLVGAHFACTDGDLLMLCIANDANGDD
jgi:hypothetical protein